MDQNVSKYLEKKAYLEKMSKRCNLWMTIAFVWVFIIMAIDSLIWDNIILDILAYLGFIYPLYLAFYLAFKLEPDVNKLNPYPKSDFPLFQRDEKHFKKVKKFFKTLSWVAIITSAFLVINSIIIVDLLEIYAYENADEDISSAMLLLLLGVSWMMITYQTELMRLQYIKHYKSIDDKEVNHHE